MTTAQPAAQTRASLALKPCPFCGSADIRSFVNGMRPNVECRGCGAVMPADTSERAEADWNRRVGGEP